MSDGTCVSLALFHAGTNPLRADEQVGKTLAEAESLIGSWGETIRSTAVPIEGKD
jgi:hypothetical protein